jgi:tetratricopeptide (TPR) repeat protein
VKSSEGARLGGRATNALHALLLVLTGFLIASTRPGLAASFKKLHATADDYLLPDTDVAVVASLGYRAALADFIFGHVLVSHGLHFQERRLFEHVGDYLDVINRLDPKFRDPYRFADTLLTLQPATPPLDFYRRAAKIQERGLKELPYDQELWATAGQFMAYLVPGRLTDPAEKLEYERAGARCLMRACELIGSNENIPFHCITAAQLLSQDGNREAARSFLERVLTVSDNDELRRLASGYLKAIQGEQEQARIARRDQRVLSQTLRDGLTFLPRVELDSLFPSFDTAVCAGRPPASKTECATSWRAFAAQDADVARAAP